MDIVQQLASNHEEADTILFLHCAYAAQSTSSTSVLNRNIVIQSPDTDVFIIAISLGHLIEGNLLFHTERGDLQRTIDIQAIQLHLGIPVSEALIGLHTFTGCDFVSAFYGRGKTKALKMMMAHEKYQAAF